VKLSTRLRRPAEAAADPAPDGPPSPPTPPRGSPVAAYAGILDGQTLWLAIPAAPGTLALRDEGGAVHPLASDLPEDDPAYRSVRASLLDLPGQDDATYDAVLVPGSGRAPRTIWTAPLNRGPTRVPPSRSGAWQFSLGRAEDGTLRVRRRRREPGCDVLAMDVTEEGLVLTLAAGDGDLLVLEDDEVVATFPVTPLDGAGVALLTEPELPEPRGQLVRLALGTAGARVPLRRWNNDLTNPGAAVLLPQLHGADPDIPTLRLRYAPDGTLGARMVGRPEDGAP
jgi:hypothetical protein